MEKPSLLGTEDGTIKLWDMKTRRNIATLDIHTGRVLSVAFSPDGTQFVSSVANAILLWNVEDQRTYRLPNFGRIPGCGLFNGVFARWKNPCFRSKE